jgi:transposase
MGLKRREFTREFKLSVIREVDAGKSLAQVARKYQLDPSLICKWRKLYQRHKDEAFAGRGRAYGDDARIAELESLIGRLTIENDLLKKVLQRLEQKAG